MEFLSLFLQIFFNFKIILKQNCFLKVCYTLILNFVEILDIEKPIDNWLLSVMYNSALSLTLYEFYNKIYYIKTLCHFSEAKSKNLGEWHLCTIYVHSDLKTK